MRSALAAISACTALGQFTIDDTEFNHVWQPKNPMPSKRSDMTATTIGDAIYLVGGCAADQEWSTEANMYLCMGLTKKTEKYSPLTDTYESLGDAPRSRYRHAAAAVGSSIYVFGGVDIADNIIAEVDVLDTTTGTWSTLDTNMPNATSDLSAFVHGGKIYVLGGYHVPDYTATAVMQKFDPTEAGLAAWTSAPSLTQARGDAAGGFAEGQAFALGGWHHYDWNSPLDHMEVFDPENPAGGWKVRENMKFARGDKAVAVLNDMLHVIGGETKNSDGHSVPLMDVEVYSASKDRWFEGGSIPSHRFRFVAAAHEDSLYIFGGQGMLQGSHSASGSKYPVLDNVEEYKETKMAAVSASWRSTCTAIPLLLWVMH
eukprot:gb/GFBE01065741.1/.p1 GENE.gb/GFBE01065741.1/~~gb/GFBE01065741.1/.p1  ORF type:complete len:372 (+),score=78.51 gb/GFBE01065741.1/:1-1116(+)